MTGRATRGLEAGSVTMFVAVLGLSFLMAAGLAIDGARKLGGLSEARDLADNAARACAQGINPGTYRATGDPILDATDAETRAMAYLAVAGTGGAATVTVSGTECTVTVTLTVATRFLPGPYTVSATETAQTVAGVEEATP